MTISPVLSDSHTGATKPKETPAIPVVVAEVVRGQMQTQVWYSGSAESRDVANLSTESEGRIVDVAEIGTQIKLGDVVARLDDSLLNQSLNEAQANIESMSARVVFLERETERLQKLMKNSNAAVSRYEEMRAELKVARAERVAARARAEHEREMVHRMKITAPFDGVVKQRYAELGEWAGKGDPILRFIGVERMEIHVGVSKKALAHVKIGDVLTILAQQQEFPATVRVVLPVADLETRLFELRLDIEPRAALLPGQLVRVSVPLSATRDALIIPEDALVIRGDGISVFVINDKMIARRIPVRTGLSHNAYVEVIGSIEAGQKIVVRGGERLREGLKVRFIDNQASS